MNTYLIALLVALPFLIDSVSADRCTYYSYCESGYHCCKSNTKCCADSTDIFDWLSPKIIAGIAIGALFGLLLLISLLVSCVKKLLQPRRRVATVPQPTTDTVSHVQQGNIPPPGYSAEQENMPPPDYTAQQGTTPPPDYSAPQENMPPPDNSAEQGNTPPSSNSAQNEMHPPPQPANPPPPAQYNS